MPGGATTPLEALTQQRKSCRVCPSGSPGLIENGSTYAFDPPVLSHWSQWLGDPHPKLVVVGQDFGNLAYFKHFEGKDDSRNQTNTNLHSLLQVAGIYTKKPPETDLHSGVYLTNSVLCFKTHPAMNGPLKSHWISNCTHRFLMPLLQTLQPRAIVTMGGPAWEAARKLFSLSRAPASITQAAGRQFAFGSYLIFPVGHCGPLGLRNRRGELQVEDWERIGAAVQ